MSNRKKILTCIGTRPNLIKVTQLEKEFAQLGNYEYKLLHTGQHFDKNMSAIFFEQLKIREPDFYLGITGGSHNEVVGRIMVAMEDILESYQPNLMIVPGDVNSTFACAFSAASKRIPVAHIESGLRSFDMDMPEERNRILTDQLSDFLFVTEDIGRQHLLREGVADKRIHLVGNTIIDAIVDFLPVINQSKVLNTYQLKDKGYLLVTFHRPVNVDSFEGLKEIVKIIQKASTLSPVLFPIHPRTLNKLKAYELYSELQKPNIQLIEPQGYIEFMKLIKHAKAVISDSGGIQVETSYFGIPCLTVRDTTELQITLQQGTNCLLPLDADTVYTSLQKLPTYKTPPVIDLWDGKATKRLVHIIDKTL